MKPVLVIGLGSELAGDDCIGCRLVEWLALDDVLRDGADFTVAGSDVLCTADRMLNRERIVLVDAMLCDAEPGTVSVLEEPFEDVDIDWRHAHAPSAVQAVELLKAAVPGLHDTHFHLIAVAVPEVRFEDMLSARFSEIAARVHDALVAIPGVTGGVAR